MSQDTPQYVHGLENQIEQLQQKLAEAERWQAWKDERQRTRLQYIYSYVVRYHGSFESWRGVHLSSSQAKQIIKHPFPKEEPGILSNLVAPQQLALHGAIMDRNFDHHRKEFPRIGSIFIEVIACGGRDGRPYMSQHIYLYKKV